MSVRLLFLAVVISGCSGPTGDVEFTTATAPSKTFADGWVLTYRKFLVILKEITISDSTGKVIFKQPNGLLFDLKRPGPFTVQTLTGVKAQKYDTVSYAIGFDGSFQIVDMSAATLPDATLMRNKNFSVYVEGNATKGSSSKEFQWGFAQETVYEKCAGPDGTGGLTVLTGSEASIELTIAPDRLFIDHLAPTATAAAFRFEAFAKADQPTDGTITLDELAAVQLSSIAGTPYDVGSASDVKTLKDFLFSTSRSLGHYRGDGECTPRAK